MRSRGRRACKPCIYKCLKNIKKLFRAKVLRREVNDFPLVTAIFPTQHRCWRRRRFNCIFQVVVIPRAMHGRLLSSPTHTETDSLRLQIALPSRRGRTTLISVQSQLYIVNISCMLLLCYRQSWHHQFLKVLKKRSLVSN